MVVRNLLADQFVYLSAAEWLTLMNAANHVPEGVPALGVLVRGERRLRCWQPVEQASQQCIRRGMRSSRRRFQARILFVIQANGMSHTQRCLQQIARTHCHLAQYTATQGSVICYNLSARTYGYVTAGTSVYEQEIRDGAGHDTHSPKALH